MHFAVAALALMLLADAGLDELLARIRAATGAPYAHHVVSLSHETTEGRTFEVTSESEGYRLIVRRCREAVCQGTYFDGERDFVVNINDTALPRSLRPDDDERTVRAIATSAFASPAFHADGGTVTELPSEERGGHTFRRLAIATHGSGPLDVLIDPKSALPVAATNADGKTVLEYRDYRRVKGVMLPFQVWRNGSLVDRYDTRELAREPLHAPPGVMPSFEDAPAALAMRPIARGSGTLPVVDCTVGEVKTRCLIDTGNSALGMSLELAERLDLEPFGEFEVAGLGHYVTGLVSGGTLRVGNATFPPARYVVLHDVHEYGFDVVLGADALANTRVILDYGRRSVTIEPVDLGARIATVPLRFENFVPVLGVQLGAFDVPLALDTGDEAAINVSAEYYADHPGLFTPQGQREVGGIGGTGEQVVGEVRSVRIATFEVAHQPIAATRGRQPTASGHLGNAFLAHFTVILDYARARLGLIPRSGDTAVTTVP